MPLFVVGFLATMVLRTTGVVPPAVLEVGSVLTTLLFAASHPPVASILTDYRD